MKKYGSLICLLLLIVVPGGFTLDIYVNDALWHSYSDADLSDLRTELSPESMKNPAIPFTELIPLMRDIDSLRIDIIRGEVQLEVNPESLRNSFLTESGGAGWNLSLDGSLYKNPGRIYIYGLIHGAKTVRIWAEPGLEEIRRQLEVWGSLHKTEILYSEIRNLKDELIHRKLTGDLMPDFILSYLTPDESFDTEKTISYSLQSLLAPAGWNEIETLVTPTAYKAHPDLYLSILASLQPGDSPLDPVIPDNRISHQKAAAVYGELIISRRILDQTEFHMSEAFRKNSYAFFPSTAFPLQSGEMISVSMVLNLDRPLSSRVLPLVLETTGEGFTQGTLLDFLKLPGIQNSFLSVSARQLPSEMEILDHRDLTEPEMNLLDDWKRGYILSWKNYTLTQAVYRRLPDLLRAEGGLP